MSIGAVSSPTSKTDSNESIKLLLSLLSNQSQKGATAQSPNSIFGITGYPDILGANGILGSLGSDSIFNAGNALPGNNLMDTVSLKPLTTAAEEDLVAKSSAGAVNTILNMKIPPIPAKKK